MRSDRPAARANLTVSASITSRVPARARRIIIASLKRERFSAGSSEMRAAVEGQEAPADAEHADRRRRGSPAGSQPRFTAKVRIRISPTQKVGTEKPRIETPMISLASGLSGPVAGIDAERNADEGRADDGGQRQLQRRGQRGS